MERFNERDLEFLRQGELFYSGSQPTWSDLEWDVYRKDVFEPRFGDVTNYMKSLKLGQHVDHRPSGRFRLDKVPIDFEYAARCHQLMDASPNSYWMYKYDGCSLVAYYTNGKLVQVCTKSAVEWGIDRTPNLSWIFPECVDPSIDSIQGEAVVKVSEVGGEYAARSKANGLINSKYKSDEVRSLIHVRAFKVGFVDLDPSIDRMISALESLPIPDHGRFQVAKRLTKSDVTDSAIGSEDILYDGIVRYGDNQIIGYKRHSDEHLVTKIKNIEWNLSSKGLMVPKFIFETVVFNAVYDDEGKVIGGIRTSKASCGSANRLFGMKAGVGSVVEVFRANSTIPQVSKVITPSNDFDLAWLDDRYYEEGYEFNWECDPWKVIENKGYYAFGGGIRTSDGPKDNMKSQIEYWYGVDNWINLRGKNSLEFIKFIFYKTHSKFLKKMSPDMLNKISDELMDKDSDKFDFVVDEVISVIGEGFRDSLIKVKDEFITFKGEILDKI